MLKPEPRNCDSGTGGTQRRHRLSCISRAAAVDSKERPKPDEVPLNQATEDDFEQIGSTCVAMAKRIFRAQSGIFPSVGLPILALWNVVYDSTWSALFLLLQ